MAKPKKEIDVTKPLKEPAYEAAAIARANGATKYEAYQLAYPKASYDTARAEATQLLKAQYIDERALQLLASQGLSEAKLAKSLNDCVDSKNETIKLAATSKGFDLLGYGKQADKQATSYNPVQINIIIEDNKAQVPDTIDVTAIDTQP